MNAAARAWLRGDLSFLLHLSHQLPHNPVFSKLRYHGRLKSLFFYSTFAEVSYVINFLFKLLLIFVAAGFFVTVGSLMQFFIRDSDLDYLI